MLSRHPEVCIPPELEVTGTLAQDFLRINALPWRSLSRLCLARIVAHHDFDAWNLDARYLFRVVAALPPARRGLDQLLACVYEEYRDVHKRSARLIGDKTPLNTLYLEWLDAMFPDACYVHVLRDGRAVVESLVRNWGDLNDEASLLKGCEIWRERVHRARRFCASRARGRSIEIRYEELVDDPGSTLVRVADLLGIDFHREMLEHRSGYAELGDTTAAHMSTLAEPLSKDRNAKWRDLSIPARDLIVTALQDDLLELGYLP
jgi:hypothetical protein